MEVRSGSAGARSLYGCTHHLEGVVVIIVLLIHATFNPSAMVFDTRHTRFWARSICRGFQCTLSFSVSLFRLCFCSGSLRVSWLHVTCQLFSLPVCFQCRARSLLGQEGRLSAQ